MVSRGNESVLFAVGQSGSPLASPLTDDAYENNDTLLDGPAAWCAEHSLTVSNLVMADRHDWYQFSMSGPRDE